MNIRTPFLALLLVAAPLSAQDSTVTLLGYRAPVPRGWSSRAPSSQMRLAEFVTPASERAPAAEVVIYFFGTGQGGSVDANLARWKAQFSTTDGSPVPETVTHDNAGAFPLTFAEYRGTYARGIGTGGPADQAKPNQTLFAAIAETPRGTLFIQLFGPTPGVESQRDALLRLARALASAPPRR